MTSNQLEKKFNIPKYDSSHCEINGKTDFNLLGKYLDEYSKLINNSIKKAKENEFGILSLLLLYYGICLIKPNKFLIYCYNILKYFNNLQNLY